MAQTGRKYKPTKKDLQDVFEMACQGASDKAIYEHLDIDHMTFYKNLRIFSTIIKRGKKVFDKHLDRAVPEVVNSLKRRCLGYEYDEVSTKQKGKVVNGVLVNGDVERTVTKKFIPASDVAIIFFLCNRDPNHWKNSYRLERQTV
jgi:hypothetical protein